MILIEKDIYKIYNNYKFRLRVDAIVLKGMDHILLGFGKDKKTNKKFLTLPGGGVDEKDKSLKDAIIRETLEEIGIQIKNIKNIKNFYNVNWTKMFKGKKNVPDFIWRKDEYDGLLTKFFICEYDKINKKLYGSEPDKYKIVVVKISKYIKYLKKQIEKNKKEDVTFIPMWKIQIKILENIKGNYN